MIKKVTILTLLLFVFMTVLNAQTETNKDKLLKFAKEKSAQFQAMKAQVEKILRDRGYNIKIEESDGRIIEVQRLVRGIPQYYSTFNINAAKTTRTDKLWAAPFNESGSGYNKLGEWDGGGVRLTHQEFSGRVTQEDSPSGTSTHSTHVAGTLIAAGVDPNAKGMAYQGNLKAWDWNDDEAEMATAAANGLEISNHSYGYIRGWTTTWGDKGLGNYWYGDKDVSTTEDYWFGFYDDLTKDIDQIAYDAPYYLIVKSAGNDRGEGPVGGLTNYWWDSAIGDWVTIPAGSTPDIDGGATGYDCIGIKGIAKNILTVGAVEDVNNYTGPDDVVMSSFSGWGPADDGRIKPDIVGNGVSLYSSSDASDNAYTTYSGTSMSAPNVSGTLALLQNYYQSKHSGQAMRAATLKALIIHTADEAGPAEGPDYQFGWGLLNAERAAQVIDEDVTSNNTIDELVLNNGATYTRTVSVDGTEPLIVTICWTDVPGTPTAPALDPGTPMLVNDLDLKVTKDGTTYYPYKLDRLNPSAPATKTSTNDVDNVEKVYIASPSGDAPLAGNYTIEVSHKGTLTNGSQAFSLIVSGDNTPLPVELVSFNAKLINSSIVELTWKTATEVNNYGFEIERAVITNPEEQKVVNWEKVGFVMGAGNSNSPKIYKFVDNNPTNGTTFIYRLKQIDVDGTIEYSGEVVINVLPNKTELQQNYPNPFNPTTNIKFSLAKAQNVKLEVYDVLGKKIATLLDKNLNPGFHSVNFNATGLANGIYIYKLKTENSVQTRKMLLIK